MTSSTRDHRQRLGLVLTSGVLAAFALRVAPLQIFTGTSDPSFYLGYVNDYAAMAARFGQTYHGNRLSYILVDALAFGLFGPESGYFIARWVALTVTAAALGLVAHRRSGFDAGLLIVGLVVLLPWLPRQLLWVHYDGFAVAYIAAAAALALLRPRSPSALLLAGALMAFAVNTNLTVLVVVASFGLAWVASHRSVGTKRLAQQSASFVAGFVVAQGVLSVILRALVGSGPIYVEKVAIDLALRLAGDDTWFLPLGAALRSSPYLLIVPVLVIALSVALRSPVLRAEHPETATLGVFAASWLGLLGLVAILLQVVFRHTWLSAPFYNIHFLVPMMIALIALLGLLGPTARTSGGVSRVGARGAVGVIAGGVAVNALLWAVSVEPYAPARWVAGAGAVGLVWSAVAVGSKVRRNEGQPGGAERWFAHLAVVTAMMVFWASPSQIPTAGGFTSMTERNAFEWDVFRHQLAVQHIVEAGTEPHERLMFWHTTVMPQGEWMTRINMVYYGTGQGRLHDKREPVGMPDLPFDISGELLDVRPLNLVLISPDAFEVEAGLLALRSRGLDPRVVHEETLDGDVLDLRVVLVRLD